MRRVLLAGALLAALAALAGLAVWHPWSESAAVASWRKPPDAPLSPREGTLGVWTGREILVVGGSDGPPCPPNASCTGPVIPPRRNGAAYDPQANSWRRIADAPVGIDYASGSGLVGRTVYLLVDGSDAKGGAPRTLLRYSLADDRWSRLRPPRKRRTGVEYSLVAAGDRLIAYGGTRGKYSPGRARVYNPERDNWTVLPADPLSPGHRVMTWTGRRLVAISCQEESESGPCLSTAAELSFASGKWTRYPDSRIELSPGPWALAGDRLVNVYFGYGSGNGGVLDLSTRRWSELPNRPSDDAGGAGVLSPTAAHYLRPGGWVLDTTTHSWILMPDLDDDLSYGTAVSAGRDLFVFGGVLWKGQARGELLNDAWIWTPDV